MGKATPGSKAAVAKPGSKPTPSEAAQKAKAQKEEEVQDGAATSIQAALRARLVKKKKKGASFTKQSPEDAADGALADAAASVLDAGKDVSSMASTGGVTSGTHKTPLGKGTAAKGGGTKGSASK